MLGDCIDRDMQRSSKMTSHDLPFEGDQAKAALSVIREHKTRGNMRPISTVFREWLDRTILDNANAATMALAPTLPSPDMYRQIVPSERQRDVLQAAAIDMDPIRSVQEYQFQLPVQMLGLGEAIGFELIMPVPEGWETILFPSLGKRCLIGSNNLLTELLRPCLTGSARLMTLRYVVSELLDAVNDRGSIRHMFPWIVEAINESEWATDKRRFHRRTLALPTTRSSGRRLINRSTKHCCMGGARCHVRLQSSAMLVCRAADCSRKYACSKLLTSASSTVCSSELLIVRHWSLT